MIEIAALVTDGELNVLGDGVDLVIHAPENCSTACFRWWPRCTRPRGSPMRSGIHRDAPAEAQQQVLDYIREFVPSRGAPLCGNSIATDRGFITRDMPELDAFLHYRMIDVSSVKELARRWYPRVYFGQPTKGLAHRALADIRESFGSWRITASTCSCRPRPRRRQAQEIGRHAVVRPGRATGVMARLWSGSSPVSSGCASPASEKHMVGVAQLVEHLVVVQVAAGSSPVTHPTAFRRIIRAAPPGAPRIAP